MNSQAEAVIAGRKALMCACATLRARASRTTVSSCWCCALSLGSHTEASCTVQIIFGQNLLNLQQNQIEDQEARML